MNIEKQKASSDHNPGKTAGRSRPSRSRSDSLSLMPGSILGSSVVEDALGEDDMAGYKAKEFQGTRDI